MNICMKIYNIFLKIWTKKDAEGDCGICGKKYMTKRWKWMHSPGHAWNIIEESFCSKECEEKFHELIRKHEERQLKNKIKRLNTIKKSQQRLKPNVYKHKGQKNVHFETAE